MSFGAGQIPAQRPQIAQRGKEMESMAANDETLGGDEPETDIRQRTTSSLYGSINATASTTTSTSTSTSMPSQARAGGTSSSGGPGDRQPGLRRVQSFYTPYMEDKLCRRLKFHFMGPDEKIKARRRCPWKLCIQIVKIILVTVQVIQFGKSRFSLVEFIEKTSLSLKHMYLAEWDRSFETMPYPPATGIYAIYDQSKIEKHINFAMQTYDSTSDIAIGALKFYQANGTRRMITMCVKHYKTFNITPHTNKYEINSSVQRDCRPIGALNDGSYNITAYWKEKYNLTIDPDLLLTVTLKFPLKSFRLDLQQRSAGPQLFRVDVTITLDDSNQDGQMTVNLETDVTEVDTSGHLSDDDADHMRMIGQLFLDSFVILFVTLSILLCSRSVIRAQQLKRETMVFFKNRFGKSLSISDQCEFLNLWYVTIIINDILTLVGTGYKIQLETRNLKSSSDNYDICSIMLGTGGLLAWMGLLRYIGFFKQFNVLIVTLKMAFPNMLRFLLCTLLLYFGFMICGWAVLGPYHIKFRHISTASECLFSLVNGDDMFVTFSATMTKSSLIWYFSRIYLYFFISLYIYAVLNLFIAVILDSYETIKDYYMHGFPKSELFEFIEQCQEPAHHPIYRQEASGCDPMHLLCCCCRSNPDRPSEYSSLVS